ncbi:flagellar assembly peptidoglycan hydrolase FlgJ [Lysobacter terrae]
MRLTPATGITLEPASTGSSHARIEEAAHSLETQFAHMLIKSMRSASMGDPMLGNDTTYRDMYDQQLAKELSKGRGLGLAPMIVRQLERNQPQAPTGVAPFSQPGNQQAPLPLSAPTAPMALPTASGMLPLTPTSAGISMQAVDLPPVMATVPDMATCESSATKLDCSSPEAFVRSIWPMAQKTASELGVPARALVAQAALETGWGRRLVQNNGGTSHNLFGIKAGGRWSGARMSATTHEYANGQRHGERADFRAYGSVADSFADYARLLGKDRYAAARGAGEDVHRFASALQQAGYATDPSYAKKISAIANGATLNRALAMLPGQNVGVDQRWVASADVAATPKG